MITKKWAMVLIIFAALSFVSPYFLPTQFLKIKVIFIWTCLLLSIVLWGTKEKHFEMLLSLTLKLFCQFWTWEKKPLKYFTMVVRMKGFVFLFRKTEASTVQACLFVLCKTLIILKMFKRKMPLYNEHPNNKILIKNCEIWQSNM